MRDFEKLGVFYLGRPYDVQTRQPGEGLLLYDSKDLVTHAVCVGMTGSGKTGLCISLLEEAVIDGVPAIVIDPKGDLPNLLLTFPDLRPEDFAPWINEEDARRKGLSPADYAREQAELWKKGLAEWGQDGERIRRLEAAADFAIYTPGSHAGLPVSILGSFAAPPAAIREDDELMRERIGTTATSLLGLLGIEADPIRSREHILISTILGSAWAQGQNLDLAALIRQIQTPPVSRIGVVDLEAFYPSKERFALAMSLNGLLAAPGFGAWMEGEPLDVGQMLHTPEGKPRLAIFSIAHLGDAERMFFVSLLLNETLGWMRAQSGTTSLRAILYMDEILGYFPPVANPPSKGPLLTLLKQARAFGLGVVLATQNPVDLDYKGLSNAGTWFIGRLQTERDKARLLDGLEGAAAGAGWREGRGRMEEMLAGLGSRIFLMNNVHDDAPVVFETRWAMSYLRGPLTRSQIKVLMDARRPAGAGPRAAEAAAGADALPAAARPEAGAGIGAAGARAGGDRPVLPPDVRQHFVPVRESAPAGAALVYEPAVLGAAQVRFVDPKSRVDVTQDVVVLTPITGEAVPVSWDRATAVGLTATDLEDAPAEAARFADLPAVAGKAKSYESWGRDFAGWLYRTRELELLKSPGLGEISQPGESERDFRVRLQQAAREQRDELVERLRRKYAPKIAALEERLRRAEQAVAREAEQATQQKIQTAISLGATLLGSLLGRRTIGTSTLGRATTAARGVGRSMKEAQDVGRARETVEALRQQVADLEAQFESETDTVAASVDPLVERLETVEVRPTRANVAVQLVTLAWAPHWRDPQGKTVPAWACAREARPARAFRTRRKPPGRRSRFSG